MYCVATIDGTMIMGALGLFGLIMVPVIVCLIVCRSRVKETLCNILPPNQINPPEISHLQTPDDWYIKCEDAGYRYCDVTLLRFGFEPAHHIQYDRFESPISIKPGPKSGLGDAKLANAWTMVEMLKDEKIIPDEWKGKRIVFAGSSYYRTRPYTLRKINYYVPEKLGLSYYGPLRVGERAHRLGSSSSTVYGIYDGEFVPVLHYRDMPKEVLCTRRVDFEYRNGPTDPHDHTSYFIGLYGDREVPPGWEVEFVSVNDLKDDNDLFFAVVPDGTNVLNEKNYESPPSSYTYLNKFPNSVSTDYKLLPVDKETGYP